MTRIETPRLVLRPFRDGDVDHIEALHNDPLVMRFLNGGEPAHRADVEREYRERFAAGGYWAADERATGAFAGWFGLHPDAERPTGELQLGYRLRRAVWGRGLATEGSLALLGTAFTGLGASRVWARTMAVNRASRRVMEKAGLRYVGTFHKWFEHPLPGTELGEVEYAITRDEWERSVAPTGE